MQTDNFTINLYEIMFSACWMLSLASIVGSIVLRLAEHNSDLWKVFSFAGIGLALLAIVFMLFFLAIGVDRPPAKRAGRP